MAPLRRWLALAFLTAARASAPLWGGNADELEGVRARVESARRKYDRAPTWASAHTLGRALVDLGHRQVTSDRNPVRRRRGIRFKDTSPDARRICV